jgi:hypothetical protein
VPFYDNRGLWRTNVCEPGANLQIDLPAGTTSPGGDPGATDGYVRVAAEGVYSSPSGTLDFHMFLFVSDDAGADTGNCSINGVIVPT